MALNLTGSTQRMNDPIFIYSFISLLFHIYLLVWHHNYIGLLKGASIHEKYVLSFII